MYDAYNLSVSAVRGSYKVTAPVLLSANRCTRFNKITEPSQGILDMLYEPREVSYRAMSYLHLLQWPVVRNLSLVTLSYFGLQKITIYYKFN